MDPPLISEGSFSTANPSLAEIWPFCGGGGAEAIGDASGLLGLRMGSGGFGSGLMGGFLDGPLANRDRSIEESTVTEQSVCQGEGGGRRRRDMGSEDESSKLVSTVTARGNVVKESIGKRMRISGTNNGSSKTGGEGSSNGGGKTSEGKNQQTEPPKDYIHVRARRGQATDSHSLAERARREKISERMKLLQDLVPGCNKVIGKALVLDEIINYIQSLQRQVEFLSMKLEAVNSGINPLLNGYPPKDLGSVSYDATGMIFGSQPTGREFETEPHSDWLHMQLGGGGGGFDRTS